MVQTDGLLLKKALFKCIFMVICHKWWIQTSWIGGKVTANLQPPRSEVLSCLKKYLLQASHLYYKPHSFHLSWHCNYRIRIFMTSYIIQSIKIICLKEQQTGYQEHLDFRAWTKRVSVIKNIYRNPKIHLFIYLHIVLFRFNINSNY